MYCNRLHAWWSTNSRLVTLLSSLISRLWVGIQTLWRFQLKDLSMDEMVGAWCFGCCQAPRGLSVGLLLLRYAALCIVESLSFLYLLFISWFLCFRRCYTDKLGFFHTNQNSMCMSWSASELRLRLALSNRVKPSCKIFLLTVPGRCFFCGSFVLCNVLCLPFLRVCSLLPCGHLLGKGWPLGSCMWCLLCFCCFPMWYPGSGVVLDCIVSWSLPSFLLSHVSKTQKLAD